IYTTVISSPTYNVSCYHDELREPQLHKIALPISADECIIDNMRLDSAMLPNHVEVTNLDKVFWPHNHVTKSDLLVYMREVAPYMLPFLRNRLLTVIRCPDGITKESFFQKHRPYYTPSYIKVVTIKDETFIHCDQIDALL